MKENVVLSLKQYQLKQDKILAYPIALLQGAYRKHQHRNLEEGWEKLVANLRKDRIKKRAAEEVFDTLHHHLKKVEAKSAFCTLRKRTLLKKNAYRDSLLNFEMKIDRIRIRLIFDSFTMFTIKASTKIWRESEEERRTKREQTHRSGLKQKEQVNEWNRKIRSMQAQVNDQKIQSSKKRTDISRETGARLSRKNDEMKKIETNTAELEDDLETLASDVERREVFLSYRSSEGRPFNKLFSLYLHVDKCDETPKGWLSILKKIPSGEIEEFKGHPNFWTKELVWLKNLVMLYE